jgi:RNA polymerase sigma-70 factor (ECF subfamily)
MDGHSQFDSLMQRLQRGDERAARDVFQQFAHRLVGLARSRIDDRYRRKVEPEDVVQSAFNSFFQRHADQQYQLADWDSLWSLLALITIRKCGHHVEHFRAACRDVVRESPLAAMDDQARQTWEVVAADPTPSQAAMLTETVETLMAGLAERERQIAMLALQGCTTAEISEQVARSERTVRRVLERIKHDLERMQDAGD